MLRSLNDVIRSLLFQASVPPSYWVEALHHATYLRNILPTKTLDDHTPHHALFGSAPVYDHLRVFGCACYPNLSATAAHKLAPRSALCIFLGYSDNHKGYRCLDLASNRVIISRHVIFDEHCFPFVTQSASPAPADLSFLDDFTNLVPLPIGPARSLFPAGSTPPSTAPSCLPLSEAALDDATQPCAAPALLQLAQPRAAPAPLQPAQPRAAPAPLQQLAQPRAAQPAAAPAVREFRFVYSRRPAPPPAPTAPPGSAASPAPAAPATIPAGTVPAATVPAGTAGAVPTPPVTNQHAMTTRAKAGYRIPAVYHTSPLSPLPKTFRNALADPNWRAAMEEEYAALLQNHTWDLVPRPSGANVVSGKWIFKHKLLADGSLERYKARWVLRGFTQRPGVDFGETFSPVVKPTTVRTVQSALCCLWPCPGSGPSTSSMSRMHSSMGRFLRRSTAPSLQGSRTPLILASSVA